MPRGVYIRTDEMKKNMSVAKVGNTNGFRKGHKGHVPPEIYKSEEHRNKMSVANKGKKHSADQRLANSLAHKGLMVGERHWRWKKDRTTLKQSEKKHLCIRYLEWMKSVKNRDGWKCRIGNADCSGRIEAHHILRWADHPELRYEVNNGITLCQFHHPLKINDEVRLIPTFQALVSEAKTI